MWSTIKSYRAECITLEKKKEQDSVDIRVTYECIYICSLWRWTIERSKSDGWSCLFVLSPRIHTLSYLSTQLIIWTSCRKVSYEIPPRVYVRMIFNETGHVRLTQEKRDVWKEDFMHQSLQLGTIECIFLFSRSFCELVFIKPSSRNTQVNLLLLFFFVSSPERWSEILDTNDFLTASARKPNSP